MNTDRLLAVHGSLMFVGWGVLIPLGAYVAVFERDKLRGNWVLVHQGLMLAALAVIAAAYVVAFCAMDSHVDKVHKIIGHVLLAWLIGQAVLGGSVHRSEKAGSWRLLHRVSGSMLVVCGLGNLGLGLADHRWCGPTVAIAYALYCVSLLVIFLWAHVHRQLEKQGHLDPLSRGPPSPTRPNNK